MGARTVVIKVVLLFCCLSSANAQQYLGFDLGNLTYDDAVKQLKQENANFDANLGYKGFNELLVIRINSCKSLDKHGVLKDGRLLFDENKNLFAIHVEYEANSALFDKIKNALDLKYGYTDGQKMFGFKTWYFYKNSNADIALLVKRQFDKVVNLELRYADQKLEPAAIAKRKEIDLRLKEQNAKEIKDDL